MRIRPAFEWSSGEPGLYADVSEDVYHATAAVSNSRLSKLKISPAHLKASIDTPFEETPSLAFGQAAHCAVLQPMEFLQRYDTARQCSALLGSGERCTAQGKARHRGHWFCGRKGHAPDIPVDTVTAVSQSDFAAITGMQQFLRKMPEVRALIDQPGGFEISALWHHSETGLPCKCRIDFLSLEAGVLVDYKTSRDASPEGFARKMFDYGYHRQGAWYLDGMKTLGIEVKHFVLVAQEKEPPFAACAFRIVSDALTVGRGELRELMETYAECAKKDEWPAYDTGRIIDIDLPDWVYRRHYGSEVA